MFTKIDINNWERAERFNHFMNIVPCDYSITANIDITTLIKTAKAQKIKLYPALIYMLTKVVNQISELRLGYDENKELGFHDICHPSYTIPNAIETSFSGIWTYMYNCFSEFYHAYLKDIEIYSKATTYAPKANQPYNTFYVSCAPEIKFTALNLHIYNGAGNLTPMFTWGKYAKSASKVTIPLSSHLHHAACDGYHVGMIYKKLQELANSADTWLKI